MYVIFSLQINVACEVIVARGAWLGTGAGLEWCRRQDLAVASFASGRQRPSVSGPRKTLCKWNFRPNKKTIDLLTVRYILLGHEC